MIGMRMSISAVINFLYAAPSSIFTPYISRSALSIMPSGVSSSFLYDSIARTARGIGFMTKSNSGSFSVFLFLAAILLVLCFYCCQYVVKRNSVFF